MRRNVPGSAQQATLLTLFGLAVIATTTALAADPAPKAADETVADLAEPTSTGNVRVEGVGLVIGLQGTGSDPGPSYYREKLVEEMKRYPDLDHEKILASKNVSLVVIRASIPPGLTPDDPLDVEISLPDDSTTDSLRGGFLLKTRLREVAIAGGGQLEGKELATAYGPVLLGSKDKPEDERAGRILGGGRVRKALPHYLAIKEKRQNGRTAKMLQEVVNRRFHQQGGTSQVGMATAKTDKYLELRVPSIYQQNQLRYFQLVKNLPMIDNAELRAERVKKYGAMLLDPATAGLAAIKLEAIGKQAVEPLRAGLESPHPQVRFFAAEALGYLDDPAAVAPLAQAAKDRTEFRAFALASLAAMDHPSASIALRRLLDEPEPELRYGAFNALRTMDPSDPFLGRISVFPSEPVDSGRDDLLAMDLEASDRGREPEKPEEPFELYVVDSDGPPLVHVARTRRREIVLFGRGLELLPPLVLGGAGPMLLNAADQDREVVVSRIDSGKYDVRERTQRSSLRVTDVVRKMVGLGATYPEVVAVLEGASLQKNLPGPLVVDALPASSTSYDKAQLAGVDVIKESKDESLKKASAESESGAKSKPSLLDRLRPRKAKSESDDADTAEKAPTDAKPSRPGLFGLGRREKSGSKDEAKTDDEAEATDDPAVSRASGEAKAPEAENSAPTPGKAAEGLRKIFRRR